MLERTENPMVPQSENLSVQSISREVDLSWLAGIIDGEGSLNLDLKMAHNHKPYLQVKVRIYNTDVRMIQKVGRIYSDLGVVYFHNLNKKRSEKWKNQIGICVVGQGSCLKILEAVMPYLANKQECAKTMAEVIKFVKSCPKGGATWSFDYVGTDTFQKLLAQWNSAKAWHIDPSTATRRASEAITW